MRLPPFECASPASLEEAINLLGQAAGQARVLAGGTDLLPAMKRRGIAAGLLVNIKGIAGLKQVSAREDGSTAIGAAVSVNEVTGLTAWPALAQAASRVAAWTLRHMGTVGGNLLVDNRCWYYNRSGEWWRGKEQCFKRGGERCYVFPSGRQCRAAASSDLVPALVAIGARVEVQSASGSRLLAVKDLYRADGAAPHTLEPGEILTHILLPPCPAGTGSAFIKLARRQTLDFALVNVAAVISLAEDGRTCREASAAVSGSVVAPTPLPVKQLEGREITTWLLDEVAGEAVKAMGFVTYAGAMDVPAGYRRQVAGVLLRRSLEQAWERARNA
ncbi:MAG: hypothetical protein D9V47_04845 [Clostridia bacterium]|nr:MAG: hypothetical protein D9V47_04845 [Clostridia bacterium]